MASLRRPSDKSSERSFVPEHGVRGSRLRNTENVAPRNEEPDGETGKVVSDDTCHAGSLWGP